MKKVFQFIKEEFVPLIGIGLLLALLVLYLTVGYKESQKPKVYEVTMSNDTVYVKQVKSE